jgi:hypothetical protein
LKNPDYEIIEGGKITADEINALIAGIHTELGNLNRFITYNKHNFFNSIIYINPQPKFKRFKNTNRQLPRYFEKFSREYLEEVDGAETMIGNRQPTNHPITAKGKKMPWEDRLSAMYYEYAMKCPNSFLTSWFELNLNINNIFAALACRKYDFDRTFYIVGDTEISNKLRTSNANDFDLGQSLSYLQTVLRIAADPDLMQREVKITQLKWKWLDTQVFPKVFDIENVLIYWIKLEMLEHWSNLNKMDGERAFHQLVDAMQQRSGHILEEFRRNNYR